MTVKCGWIRGESAQETVELYMSCGMPKEEAISKTERDIKGKLTDRIKELLNA